MYIRSGTIRHASRRNRLIATLLAVTACPLVNAQVCEPQFAPLRTGAVTTSYCDGEPGFPGGGGGTPPPPPSAVTSVFARTASDLQVNTTGHVDVITRTVSITQPNTRVLVVADGRYFPIDAPAGSVRIAINGSEAHSSYAINDWGSAEKDASAQHSFNAIAHAVLQPGVHTFTLRAGAHPSRPGRFVVGSHSGLSVILNPGENTVVSAMAGESAVIDVTTYAPPAVNVIEGSTNRPSVEVLRNVVANTAPTARLVASLASARAFNACPGYGDSLAAIYQDGMCPHTDTASWSVNDIDPGAELQAPMFSHALHAVGPNASTNISFRASELSFGSDQASVQGSAWENEVCYKMGSARLVSVVGGQVIGSAGGNGAYCSTYTWRCVASTVGTSGCPAAGTDSVIASRYIDIPANHDGIVFFSAKTRIQGDQADGYMTAGLGIKINGVKRGTLGVQQIRPGYGVASRTLSASYLSAPGADSAVLPPGRHLVEVYMNVTGSPIKHVAVPSDVALVYFD